jgi:hypothetical protein
MVADQKPVAGLRQPDQRKPHQRRLRQIEPLQAVGVAQELADRQAPGNPVTVCAFGDGTTQQGIRFSLKFDKTAQ